MGFWKTTQADIEDSRSPSNLGGIRTHELVRHWCEGPPGDGEHKADTFWMPLVNPDTIILREDLIAKVQAQLTPPEIVWLNIDKDHDWLWVRVEHFAAIEPVPEIYVEETKGDEVTGIAHAWIRTTPTEFTITIPDADNTDGVATCDIATATSDTGCPIRFTHASSIDPSGQFTINAELTYRVESNSGKYTGLIFTRESTSTITVAEAMAVTVTGG